MATYSEIVKGDQKRAPRVVEVPRFEKEPLRIGLRLFPAWDRAEALKGARAFAVASGIADPSEADPLYVLALMAHELALACVDPDAADCDSARPFFASADEILKAPADDLGQERIVFLHEHLDLLREERGAQKLTLTPDQVLGTIVEIAEANDPGPFVRLQPGLRWILLRSMAVMLSGFLTSKSPSGSPCATEASPTDGATSSPPGDG